MEILLRNQTNQSAGAYKSLFEKIALSAEKTLKLPKTLEISVSLVRSRTMHQINYEHRGIDRPTDVISFAFQDTKDIHEMGEGPKDLGDIFINIDYAKKQAKQYQHSIKREMGFLFTHGLLHCLGYDHQTSRQEKEMFAMQDKILDPVVKRI